MTNRTTGNLELAKAKLSTCDPEAIVSDYYDANLAAIDSAISDLQDNGGGSGALQSDKVTLTAADLAAMGTTDPPMILPAPGANKLINPVDGILHYRAGVTPYTVTGFGVAYGVYGNTSGRFQWENFSGFPAMLAEAADQLASMTALGPSDDSTNYGAPANFIDKALYFIAAGALVTTVVNQGGTGYAENDIVGINGGDGNAVAIIDTVDVDGAVLTYHIDTAGARYYIGTNVATSTQTGAGSGFTIDITEVKGPTAGDGEVDVILNYTVVDLS
jgi:hypothetical protein